MGERNLISRSAAVRDALRLYRDARESARDFREAEDDFATLAFESQMEAFRWMVQVLMALPAAEADPTRRGGWIGVSDGDADLFPVYDHWECSVCGHAVDGDDYEALSLYCPACGARMSGDDAEGGGGAAAQ